jgi:hypothetical protein
MSQRIWTIVKRAFSSKRGLMVDQVGFGIRLRVRLARGLTTKETKLNISFAGKEVSVTSEATNEPLDQARWFVFRAGGFATEDEAKQFGRRLGSVLEIVGLSLRLGVDTGEDKPTGHMTEQFARAMGVIKEHERTAPNVHGLMILPDDDLTRFPRLNMIGFSTMSSADFVAAIEELAESGDLGLQLAENGVRLLNLALMTSEPLAQMLLAFSAIEELGQNEKWNDEQAALIEQLATTAREANIPDELRSEVANAIEKGLFKLSLRQGVVRLLARFEVTHLKKEWDRLYGIRSGIFHGTARIGNAELSKAAHDTIKLCGAVVFAIISKSGGQLPSTVKTHFNT